jgi:hypothetical protein
MTERRDDEYGIIQPSPILGKGTLTLNGINNVTTPCPGITANTIILLSIQVVVGVLGVYGVTSRDLVNGTFTVTSVALNTSTIGWVAYV